MKNLKIWPVEFPGPNRVPEYGKLLDLTDVCNLTRARLLITFYYRIDSHVIH